MGPQPVVKTTTSGELVYLIWRNGDTCAASSNCDGREDANMGEMVLDDSTVAGYQAGDFRFVQFEDIQTDEMGYVSMAGDNLFHSHWLVMEGATIGDRSDAKGGSFADPITTTKTPYVIWRQDANQSCSFDAATRYCTSLYSFGDTRYYGEGFYEYYGTGVQQPGSKPYTVVANGMVFAKSDDGAIIALGAGSPTGGSASLSAPPAQTPPTATPVIPYQEASKYVGREVVATGVIASAVDHLPKALYLGFRSPHDGALLVRVFQKDLGKFARSPLLLEGKEVRVRGKVTYYWPDSRDPEIIVTDPAQIQVK